MLPRSLETLNLNRLNCERSLRLLAGALQDRMPLAKCLGWQAYRTRKGLDYQFAGLFLNRGNGTARVTFSPPRRDLC
jgi:hypothetical protein